MIRFFALVLMLASSLMLASPLRAEIAVQEITSPGGVQAWLVESHDIPFLALEIRFRGGGSLDAPGKRGAINLMTALLEEGAGQRDARAFARARDELAASFRFRASQDAVAVSARVLTENRAAALEVLRQALTEPRFDSDAVERVRAQVLAGLRAGEADPNTIAANRFAELAFGGHPYGSALDGTPDSVAALTRADLQEAKARAMARDRLFVAAAGDITAAELGPLLDALFAGLPEAGAPQPGPADLSLPGGETVIPFETPQSVALFGQRGLAREHPDFFTAFVINDALGAGNFSSRLMQEVRVKRGLTYGVYSYLAPMDHAAMIYGRVASANGRIAEAIGVIRQEWRRMAGEGMTAQELEQVKTYLTGAYPLRFDGNANIARILVGMQMEGLDPAYIATRNDRIRAVTVEDVGRVAREWLDPAGLHFVVVGQPEGLKGAE
ncbi:zinc protease [Rhodovulum imhoffii]|uniref:Zinc protease n=1 Tax=Rhodovulum imhoffii TaxID=365340 RepID=A0A2T5BV19_9RHOB|nr:pitrilysin family protein [Rhodovulum imhoffii]MBK5934665.1 peptidase M16 [Rhodovulum imhoffii]PTN03360.1 zinc protease [Rhodovulum imhoffii]